MKEPLFELTNEQRNYLGLIPVESNWELVKSWNNTYLYYDGDLIRKRIIVADNEYLEQELCEKTAEKRTILLPKTTKGKPKKLNFTASNSFSPFGVYFCFNTSSISIANYTTQNTFYSYLPEEKKTIEDLKVWLNEWVAESTPDDLISLEKFKTAKRQHCKFKEGDFFAFKIGRRDWGFGRILIDVIQRRKDNEFKKNKNYGLNHLMGRPLIVKIYHKISDSINLDLNELSTCLALPSQAIMDNRFYYGEYKIIGNKELTISEYDMLISYSRSIDYRDNKKIYLQYGFIFMESNLSKFNKYLIEENENTSVRDEQNPYRKESIGFKLDIKNLEECIAENSNDPFWNSDYYSRKRDLRNPQNIEIKREIFRFFKLDADKNYEENLKLKEKRGFMSFWRN